MTAPTAPSVAQVNWEAIASRAERGWDLHLAKRQLITKTGEDTYTVPASAGGTYTVHYGDEGTDESCECTDYAVNNGRVACKHLTAVALIYARRRRVYSRCEVCGATSSEKTLVGIRNDHRRGGPRYCLPHHPESMSQGVLAPELASLL
jgi:predicted nucleic acid-binding Zn finger protein